MPLCRVGGADESVQQIREALLGAVDAAEQELWSRYMATVWKSLEKKSRDGYVAGIRRYLGVLRGRPELEVRGPSRRHVEQNADAHMVSQTRRLQSGWQAEKRITLRQNITSSTQMHDDVGGERPVQTKYNGGNKELGELQDVRCDTGGQWSGWCAW